MLALAVTLAGCNVNPPATVRTPGVASATAQQHAPAAGATAAQTGQASAGAATPSAGQGGVTAEALDTVIKLTWQPVPGASGYLVYRDGGTTPLNPKPVTSPTFKDIGLTNGRPYRYVVAATDGAGQPGQRLSEVHATPALLQGGP